MSEAWRSYLRQDSTEWLLKSNPWTRYRTLVDLLDKNDNEADVIEARAQLIQSNHVEKLLSDTLSWFPELPKRHDDSKLSHYKLRMLADFGFTIEDKNINNITTIAKKHKENDLFAMRQELPDKNKITDNPLISNWHALPCDSPLITYTLLALGDKSDEVLKTGDFFIDKWNEKKDGWFCNLFFVNSQHKQLQVGCPMSGLMCLEIFSLFDEESIISSIRNAYEPLRFHREYGKSLYYFGRSSKFWTFKYPYVWYNALYIADVLTRFNTFKNEELLKEIIDWIIESQDSEGKFTPTSMFREYSDWDFSNKKEPSPWITYLAYRILKRYFK